MGSNDIPPPHVYQHTIPIANSLLAVGGGLWTICYILIAYESSRSKSYGMPLLALPGNLAWELVYGFLIAEEHFERAVFLSWACINGVIVYNFLRYGGNEWKHSHWVQRHLLLCLGAMTVSWCAAHYAFARWWLDSGVSLKKGKFRYGIEGVDTTELGFWSASVPQVTLSLGSLAMLLSRQHTRGLSWSIWTTRFLGSILGFHVYYGWLWLMWRDAHQYFMTTIGCVLWMTSIIADVGFGFVFASIRRTETIVAGKSSTSGQADHRKSK